MSTPRPEQHSKSPDFSGLLYDILRLHPEGISEFALINMLKADPAGPFSPDLSLSEPLPLFRAHFALFHHLYLLRDRLRAQHLHELEISASNIRLNPYKSGEYALGQEDKLRSYYLDWSQFDSTLEEDVNELLESFWRGFDGVVSDQQRTEALTVLGLEADADEQQIRRRYRQLMHQHHPDKGGDRTYCQALTSAYQKLL
ncbi:DNA-J related domain-containing protein [Aliiglaciecola sp. CAU 1673]|uniref:DNA-J related domain-containing protein n=1 Tax=Aliiglaciecola sp. CAU 1673 TaxID=3032595 RepID=UPI0023D9B825|nr:DNA-J related domain-containing protein [Aliiglaciecola sp. CAU 1673]MDF2177142.1 DNA-J related domain-containing protein [Aliiglaciecola sp. CAU 1673]